MNDQLSDKRQALLSDRNVWRNIQALALSNKSYASLAKVSKAVIKQQLKEKLQSIDTAISNLPKPDGGKRIEHIEHVSESTIIIVHADLIDYRDNEKHILYSLEAISTKFGSKRSLQSSSLWAALKSIGLEDYCIRLSRALSSKLDNTSYRLADGQVEPIATDKDISA